MFRTSSKLQRAQRVHVACRIRTHANEPATARADTPTAMIIIILNNTTVLYVWKRRLEVCTSKTVCCTTVKVCDHVDLVFWYISIPFTHPQGKRTTCDCRHGEGDPSVQLYSGSVSVTYIDGTFYQRSCDAQY